MTRPDPTMLDFALARRHMVDNQLRTFDVTDARVLAAFAEVPRERFVAQGQEAFAYIDRDVPVSKSEGRVLLAPMLLARLVQSLAVRPGDVVLDAATGLGYGAAILAHIGATVHALEPSASLAAEAGARLGGEGGVSVHHGPLEAGWPDGAPYDAILLNGAVETRPDALLAQLKEGGRLACVVGQGRSAKATLFVRGGETAGSRPLFDAVAPILPAFRVEPGFVF